MLVSLIGGGFWGRGDCGLRNGKTGMSESLLYHGFGIRGYQYQRSDAEEGCVILASW